MMDTYYPATLLDRRPIRSQMEAARELVRQAGAALYYACDDGSMMAIHHIEEAYAALERAAALLPSDLAADASALAEECGETLCGSLGYAITLEGMASDLLKAVDVRIAAPTAEPA